jgi:hypothetical protein
MTNPTEPFTAKGELTAIEHGKIFIRLGLSLLSLGFILGFVPILHYMHGAVAGDVGDHFMKNMTLWWGCPALLMELTLKTGGLAMIVIGLCYVVLPRATSAHKITNREQFAPKLCNIGLIAATVYAAVGYVIINMIWPNFYFEHNEMGKDVWLAGQLIGIAIFFIGFFISMKAIRRDHL